MKLIICFITSFCLLFAGVQFSILFFFVSFIPIFIIADSNIKIRRKLWFIFTIIFSYIFLVAPWVVYKYEIVGVSILCITTTILTFPFAIAFFTKIKSIVLRLSVFVSTWIIAEFTLLNFDLFLPFNLLGNLFLYDVSYAQFYEYTGVLGGSLFILLVNTSLFLLIKYKKHKLVTTSIIVFVFLTIVISNYTTKINTDNFTKICFFHLNNIDKKKYNDLELVKKLIGLMKNKINNDIQFIILPENTLTTNNRLEFLSESIDFFYLQKFISSYSNSKIIIGAEVREYNNKVDRVVVYNSAIVIDKNSFNIISKEKFVPFEENVPSVFKLFTNQKDHYNKKSTSHYVNNNNVKAGVLICYEALYGDYVGQETKDADYIIMLARESHLRNYDNALQQYLGLIKLRAIEQRKFIVKSANDGYTALISPNGVIDTIVSPESETVPIIANVPISKNKTFYAKYGDWLGVLAIIINVIIMIYMLIKRYTRMTLKDL